MPIEMSTSRVLAKLRAGKIANSTSFNLSCHRHVSIAAMKGFDCVWFGYEHRPNDLAVIEKQILAAKEFDTDSLVRVSRGGYSDYIRPLEMDATGIIVPHIMSAADARGVARMTRYHPIGRRALDAGNADGRYCLVDVKDYIRHMNEERFVIIQIEDPEPLEELDEICDVDGIDMIFFGPADFCHSIGRPGEFDHPQVTEARRTIAETAIKHGKFAGTVASMANVSQIAELGFRFINLGSDVGGLSPYYDEVLAAFASLEG